MGTGLGMGTRHFSKKGMEMAKKHMKRCTTSIAIMEMQSKTPMSRTSLAIQWLKLCSSTAGGAVRFLVRMILYATWSKQNKIKKPQ